LFLFVIWSASGQEAVIKILDKQSNNPVPFAVVCFESIDKRVKSNATTNNDGWLKNSIHSKSIIAISSLGYISKIDTLLPGHSVTIYLEPTSTEVNEVVVTGQFKAIRSDKSIYKINIINNKQIEDKAASNLGELLSSELGLRTSQDASLGTNLTIQGLSGEHVKVLIDGIPLIGRQAGILDLSQLSLYNVDHVEIVEGPMSVVYGSNALAGAINIITKDPQHGKILGRINSYYESVGVYNFDGNATYRIKNHTVNISGGRNFFGGYSVEDTSRWQQWKPKAQYVGSIDYIFAQKNNKLRLSSDYFAEEVRNKNNPDPLYFPALAEYHYIAFDEFYYTKRFNSKADYTRKFENENQLEIVASYAYYNKTKKTLQKDLSDLSEISASADKQDTTRFYNMVGRTTYSKNTSGFLNFQAGLDANIETATGKRLNGQKRIDDYATFLSLKLLPEEKLNGQLGLRAIYNSQYAAPLIYSINLKYSPAPSMGFRASYGKGFRAPSLKELYLEFNDINHNVVGNDQLEAETSNNFNLSGNSTWQFDQQSLTFDATFFYNTISNKIDFLYRADDPTWAKYYNIKFGDYHSKGTEMKIQYQLHPRFTFSGGVNFLGRSRIPDVNQFYYSTDYTANFSYKNLKYLFRITAYYKYTDSYYTSRAYFNDDLTLSQVKEGFMKGYHSLDITFSRPFFNNKIDLAVGGKNLFNNTNILSTGGNGNVHGGGGDSTPVGWGRTWFVRLTYQFSQN
jgi:outer membrane receptor for ferrienterochelin and colicins